VFYSILLVSLKINVGLIKIMLVDENRFVGKNVKLHPIHTFLSSTNVEIEWIKFKLPLGLSV
jgi:hypothetical protein